ncbi:MAG: ABC transporter substrate-binding protein [Bacteroidetes bacterium]|nr:ABC transporter substrate-binding protein [Bacteroidota bacterium]
MKKKMFQAALVLLFLLVAMFNIQAGGAEEMVEEAAPMVENWDDVVAMAKEEGTLTVYATTSRITVAAEAFTKKYGIKVEAHRLSEVELIERAYQEAVSGVNAVDLVLIEDFPSMKALLIEEGYLENYIPPSARATVPADLQDPLVFAHISRVIGYNTEKYPEDPFTSVWDLTTPEWRGKVMIRDLAITGEHQNAFTEFIRRSDEMEANYEERFGEKLVLREANAGLEFLRRLVENDVILMTSDTKIAAAVGKKGQEDPPVGFIYVYSKHRDIVKKDLALNYSANIEPFGGYYYNMYVQMATASQHPNAAKLFADYLMSPEGYTPWSSDLGFYASNVDITPYPGDELWAWWETRLWGYDADFAIQNRGEVLDTWIKYVQK